MLALPTWNNVDGLEVILVVFIRLLFRGIRTTVSTELEVLFVITL
jgi:hypothetical protein